MAVKEITPEVLERNKFDADVLSMIAATTAADGFLIDASKVADHRLLLVFENTDVAVAYDITIKKGNGLQGVADLTKEIAATKTAAIVVESGAFKNVTGTNKGKIVAIPENAAVKMAAIVLP
jgi:hypothetical protein